MWSSLSKSGHVGVKVRVVDSTFIPRNYSVGCEPLPHPHSELLDPTTAFPRKWGKTSRYADPTKEELLEIRQLIAGSLFEKTGTVETDIFGQTVSSDEGCPHSKFLSQFAQYLTHLSKLTRAPEEDVFAFWRAHRHEFALVAHAARCLLCAFSSNAERRFSAGAYVVNK